jgi:hypothetical protein
VAVETATLAKRIQKEEEWAAHTVQALIHKQEAVEKILQKVLKIQA